MSRTFLYFITLSFLSSQAYADGLFQISGIHPERGEYTGQAWIHDSQAQRIIHWTSFRYAPATGLTASPSYEVENVWSGSANEHELQFKLKLSNVLTGYGDFQPSTEEIRNPITVLIPFSESAEQAQADLSFTVPGEGAYKETWKRVGNATPIPLWKDLRIAVDGTGKQIPWYYQLALAAGLGQAIDWYRSQPQAQAYQARDEYRLQRQYFVQDKTDADFYANHPQVLRVSNKTLNPLSLAEATMRRNAYAPKLAEKADILRKETFKNNLNEAGLLEFAAHDEKGEKIGRTIEYDSALWTAMFGWSELLRYQATRDPQALVSFKRVLDGILTLVEITGDPKTFARTIAISPPEENLGPGWIQGTGKYSRLKWRSNANNDMVKGIFITLTLAHQVLGGNETELRARIIKASHALQKMTPVTSRGFNTGLAHGLVALWSDDAEEKHDELQSFIHGVYNLETILGSLTGVNGNVYVGGVADWSGIHLSMVSTFCQILIAKELQSTLKGTNEEYLASDVLKAGESQLLDMQKTYQEAHRDFLTLMTYAFSSKAKNDDVIKGQAKEALWTLKEVPAPRFIGSAQVELSKVSGWSLSAWPRLPWKALQSVRKLKEGLSFDTFAQSAYSYPIFETAIWSSGYLWKDSPFEVRYESHPQAMPFSADYLLVYWASRVSGLLTPQD